VGRQSGSCVVALRVRACASGRSVGGYTYRGAPRGYPPAPAPLTASLYVCRARYRGMICIFPIVAGHDICAYKAMTSHFLPTESI
jgi:hypothetical protein